MKFNCLITSTIIVYLNINDADAFFSSRISKVTRSVSVSAENVGGWTPHSVLGEAKIKEFAELKVQDLIKKEAAEKLKKENDDKETARVAAVLKKEEEDKEVARVEAALKKEVEDKETARVEAALRKEVEDKEKARIAAVLKKETDDKEAARVEAALKKEIEDKEKARVEAVLRKEVEDKEKARIAAVSQKEKDDKEAAKVAAALKKETDDIETLRKEAILQKETDDKESARIAAAMKKEIADKEAERVAEVLKKVSEDQKNYARMAAASKEEFEKKEASKKENEAKEAKEAAIAASLKETAKVETVVAAMVETAKVETTKVETVVAAKVETVIASKDEEVAKEEVKSRVVERVQAAQKKQTTSVGSEPAIVDLADMFDAMQKSAESDGAGLEAAQKKLEGAISMLSKAPLPRLRDLITKYKPSILPPPVLASQSVVDVVGEKSILQNHLEKALESLWSNSDGQWTQLMDLLDLELKKQMEDSQLWMKASLVAANELSDARLKTLIKSYGGPDSLPKKKKGEELEKSNYANILVDILKAKMENDYSKVAPLLQAESVKSNGKKGFADKLQNKRPNVAELIAASLPDLKKNIS